MATMTRPETKLTYGRCLDATHLHREVMGGNYAICDNVAQYWPITLEAKTYEEAIIIACVTGSVGATASEERYDATTGEYYVACEQRWRRPKHANPYGHRQDVY
jgi:hypothetical protein